MRLRGVVVLATLLAIVSSRGALAAEPAPSALPLLTRIQDIRALSQDGGALGYPVRIRATVTHFDEILRTTLVVHDGAFGQFVMPPANAAAVGDWADLKAGDLVEIEGHTERGGFAPNIAPEKVRRLGRGPMPHERTIAFSAMLTGRYDCDYVGVAGVVQRAWVSSDPQSRVMFADVAIEDGIVRAAFWDYSSPADLTRYIDARVRLRGNIGTLFGRTEQLRGVSLFAGKIGDVAVLEPAPDPFSLPTRSIRNIYNYSSEGEVNRRIRVRGVVTARISGTPVAMSDFTTSATFRYVVNVVYVRDGSAGVRIETEQALQVRPGDLVDAAGFPGVTPGKPILRNALLRVIGSGTTPPPPMDLAFAPGIVLTPDHDAEIVRMNGQLLSVLAGTAERVLVLRSGDTVFNAGLDIDQVSDQIERIRPGSLLSVTGVYSYQGGPPPSFRLFLRSADDVRVVAAAPWWTLRHTMVMVVMLTLVACGGAFWMRMIANRKRQEYQAVLSERTRVARELHDTVEQGLAGISLQLEAVAGSFQTAPEAARQSLDVARQMLRYSLEETKRSVMDLRSQALESRDLGGALSSLARQMTLNTPTEAFVRVIGARLRPDAAEDHHLLRIGLEALTNTLKHGAATRIDIELRFGIDATHLIVVDNGRGMESVPGAASGAHFGLQGVRERVNKLEGVMNLDSTPGVGTRLAVMIPVRSGARRAAITGGESWQTS
jgi:signal transduction histidine kinase